MNKIELVTAIATKSQLAKYQANAALKALIETVTDELKQGNEIVINGFGSFHVTKRPAREGRNPRTGEAIQIEASSCPAFKAGKSLKDAVNGEK